MLRIATARYNRGTGVIDPEGIDLFDEAVELLDPEAVPLRALAIASVAWLARHRSTPSSPTTSSGERSCLPTSSRAHPRSRPRSRWLLPSATLGLPGAAHRLRLCDEALAVAPEAEDPWWDQLAYRPRQHRGAAPLLPGHSLLALGRRAEFETNLAQVTKLGETTGNLRPSGRGPHRVALLGLLDGRFR